MNARNGVAPVERPAAPAKRLDWFAEVGECQYRQGPEVVLACGCGGTGRVVMRDCSETPGTRCVATDAARQGLLKNHREIYDSVRVCNGCEIILRKA